jgi:polyisoprenoid-binding protein YceI
MVTEVRGRLTGVGAAVTIAEIMNESKGDVTIYIASVEFGNTPAAKTSVRRRSSTSPPTPRPRFE